MKLRKTISELAEKLLFPPDLYCISCGAVIDGSRTYRLCDECMAEFQWITGPSCKVCGKALGHNEERRALAKAFEGAGDALCADCIRSSHNFDRGISCVSYGPREKAPLMRLKYGEGGYLGKILGDIMYDKLMQDIEEGGGEIPFDFIVPVPLHPKRLARRGYNQASLMAGRISERLGVPLICDAVARTKATEKMSRLGAGSRSCNLAGAFRVTASGAPLAGSSVLLVDDIYTTGNTADAVSSVLKAAGARRVCILTFASGSNYIPYV